MLSFNIRGHRSQQRQPTQRRRRFTSKIFEIWQQPTGKDAPSYQNRSRRLLPNFKYLWLDLCRRRAVRRQGYAPSHPRAFEEATVSLPAFSTQAELFSTAGLSSNLFGPTDRYRLFAQVVYPAVVAARGDLEKCYCPDNGRVAIEPVLMLGVSFLQYLDGLPDRQAVEMLRYHAGWNFALNRQIGDEVFHSTSLVNFRNRLEQHQQGALAFTTILTALQEAGLISHQSRQRLDSTQMFGR